MNITRGDTVEIRFKRTTADGQVITEKPDKMYFTVKESYYIKDLLFQKKLEDDSITYDEQTNYYMLTINPEDTNDLSYKEYVYDIEIIDGDKVKTIAKGTLKITEEVTFAENEV